MAKWELLVTVALGLLGLGIMGGQDFTMNGWTIFFWSVAGMVLLYGLLHRPVNADDLASTLGDIAPSDSDLKPKVAVVFSSGTARWDGREFPSADVTLRNPGGPFQLVAAAKLVGVAAGFDWAPSDEWRYAPIDVMGGDGLAYFHISTVEQTKTASGETWLVKLRGPMMTRLRRWQGPGRLWFDVQWTFYITADGMLRKFHEAGARIVLNPDGRSFAISEFAPGSPPPPIAEENTSERPSPLADARLDEPTAVTPPLQSSEPPLPVWLKPTPSEGLDIIGNECEWVPLTLTCSGSLHYQGQAATLRVTNNGAPTEVVARLHYDTGVTIATALWLDQRCGRPSLARHQTLRLVVGFNMSYNQPLVAIFEDARDCSKGYTSAQIAQALFGKKLPLTTRAVRVELLTARGNYDALFNLTMNESGIATIIRARS
jgi:hypothetical protein